MVSHGVMTRMKPLGMRMAVGLRSPQGRTPGAVVARERFGCGVAERRVDSREVAASAGTVGPEGNTERKPSWEIRMLYDGDCPLCMREVNMLRRRDQDNGKIDFVDIAAPNYSQSDNQNISYEQAMGRIHAILPSGEVIRDVEVFKKLYEVSALDDETQIHCQPILIHSLELNVAWCPIQRLSD